MAEIVAHARALAMRQGGAENRRTARMEFQHKVRVIPVIDGGAGPSFTVFSRDISQEGLGVFTARAMRPGELFLFSLPRNERDTIFVLGQVVYCAPQADGLFAAGIKFTRMIERSAAPRVEDAGAAGEEDRRKIAGGLLT